MKQYQRCHLTHKPLVIPCDGVDYQITGGSCLDKPNDSVDLFVGLDRGMVRTERQLPWITGEEFLLYIKNNCAPNNAQEFKRAVAYICTTLKSGGSVHIGCIGGHGRTGMVLAAVYYQMTGNKAAIKIVRETYCHKAVETNAQCKFLKENYGMHAYKGSSTPRKYNRGGDLFGDGGGFGLDSVKYL